jgi:hypothetical protein
MENEANETWIWIPFIGFNIYAFCSSHRFFLLEMNKADRMKYKKY